MNIQLDTNKIVHTIAMALILYIGTTVYNLDKSNTLQEYKIEQIHLVLQNIVENKKDK